MIKGLNLALFLLTFAALVSVYALKFNSENIATHKAGLKRDIAQQEATLSMLEADWALLTQPSHIAPIVERHAEVFNLQHVRADQFGSVQDIPMRPDVVNDAALTRLLEAIDAGVDPIGDKLEELLAQ